MPILSGGVKRAAFSETVPGLYCHIDFSNEDSVTLNGSDVLSTREISGHGNDFAQGVAVNQPAYVTDVYNGLATARYNGSTHQLISNSNFWDSTTDTSILVVKIDVAATGRHDLIGVAAGNPNLGCLTSPASFAISIFARDGTANTLRPAITGIALDLSITGFTRQNNEVKLFYNDLENTATGTYVSPSMAVNTVNLGGAGGLKFQGDICEFLLYRGILDGSTLTALKNSLREKWGITS